MKIRLLWVGKTKSDFVSSGIDHYLRLLKPFISLTVVEIKEAKTADKPTALSRESDKILKQSKGYILLDERGVGYSSAAFANFLKNALLNEKVIDFLIGGPFGVSERIRQQAKHIISLSKMTLTHEMARLLLVEQLYRAFTIIKGKEYHY